MPRALPRLTDIATFGMFVISTALVLLLFLPRPAVKAQRCSVDRLFAAPKVGLRAEMLRRPPQAEASR